MEERKPKAFEDAVYDLLHDAVGFVNNPRSSGIMINLKTGQIRTREETAKRMVEMMYLLKPERFEVVKKEPAKKPTKRKAAARQPAVEGRESDG